MKVIVVVDNMSYLAWDNENKEKFSIIQEEIYQKYCSEREAPFDDWWNSYDHKWRTDPRLIELAEKIWMFKVADLPDNTTDFMTTCRTGDNYEDLLYVVDGKIFWYE